MKNIWKIYQKNTAGYTPRKLLVEAIPFVHYKNNALDIGAGALFDAEFLLNEGFNVTAIDGECFKKIPNPHFSFKKVLFEKYNFPKNQFDLVTSQFSLPFMSQYDFANVWPKVKESLVKGGIFTGQLFGWKDGWKNDMHMNFHNKSDLPTLLEGMNVLKLEEEIEDAPTASGKMKHWHVFHIIARKK